MNWIKRFSVGWTKKLTVTTSQEPRPSEDYGLTTLKFLMIVGLGGIIAISYAIGPGKDKAAWSNFGLALSIALCSLLCGGFLGFLFGIPRTNQRTSMDIPDNGNRNLHERAYGNNTNLEQISDWLTKIIVGVSLT